MASDERITIILDGRPHVFPHPSALPQCSWKDDMKLWPKVEGPQIMVYLINSKACDMKDANAFRSLESYNYLQSGWVGQLFYHKLSQHLCYLTGEVTPSQNVSDKPHKPWVCVKHEGEVLSGGCTCMAGAAKVCSHIGAILWKVDVANRLGLTGTSCTDQQSLWNQSTKRNLQPTEVRNLSFKKPKPEPVADVKLQKDLEKPQQYYSHDEFLKDFESSKFSSLLNIQGTQLHLVAKAKGEKCLSQNMETPLREMHVQSKETQKHDHKFPENCPPCLTFYSKYVALSNSARHCLNDNTILQSKSEVWKAARLIRITSSIANKVPKNPKTDPQKFLLSKLYKPFRGNSATKYGLLHEGIARKEVENIYGIEVQPCGIFISKKHPWLAASPDGLIGDTTILEIKCPVANSLDDALKRCDIVCDDDGQLSMKPKGQHGYYVQVQLAMYCSERQDCFFFVWIPKEKTPVNCSCLLIEYDSVFVNAFLDNLHDFYFRAMLPKLADDYQAGCLVVNEQYRNICSV